MAQRSGFTGISYPFRVTNRGGCAMSTTTKDDPTHIKEGIEQLLGTAFLERPMEGGEYYCDIEQFLFNPNDEGLQSALKLQIVTDLSRLEERIECDENGIDVYVETDDNGVEYLFVDITYRVVKYDTVYTSSIKVGEVNNE